MNLICIVCTDEEHPVQYCELFNQELCPDVIEKFINNFNETLKTKDSENEITAKEKKEIINNLMKHSSIYEIKGGEICFQIYNNVSTIN